MTRKTIEYSQRSQPPAFYANTRKTRIEGGIRWFNNIRINADDLQELKNMLAHARDKIREMEGRLDVLSVKSRTSMGIYLPLNPLVTGVQGVRRWIGEQVRIFNPIDPYCMPEKGLSYVINDPKELDVFLRSSKPFYRFS